MDDLVCNKASLPFISFSVTLVTNSPLAITSLTHCWRTRICSGGIFLISSTWNLSGPGSLLFEKKGSRKKVPRFSCPPQWVSSYRTNLVRRLCCDESSGIASKKGRNNLSIASGSESMLVGGDRKPCILALCGHFEEYPVSLVDKMF